MKGAQQPWELAKMAGRDYITPEDVTDAIMYGASRRSVMQAVLLGIEAKRVEDVTLCAFLALYKLPDGGHKEKKKPWLASTSAQTGEKT